MYYTLHLAPPPLRSYFVSRAESVGSCDDDVRELNAGKMSAHRVMLVRYELYMASERLRLLMPAGRC